jgi:hypothetical protein
MFQSVSARRHVMTRGIGVTCLAIGKASFQEPTGGNDEIHT